LSVQVAFWWHGLLEHSLMYKKDYTNKKQWVIKKGKIV
jgi:hypothetical protein